MFMYVLYVSIRRRRPGQKINYSSTTQVPASPPPSLPLTSRQIPNDIPIRPAPTYVCFNKDGIDRIESNRIESRRRRCHDVAPGARVDVDVSVPEAADREHHAVGVERRARDGARLGGGEERGVGLDGVDAGAVDVEEGEGMRVGASVFF